MSEHVSKNQDVILRGTDQQQTTRRLRNLLYEGPITKQYPQIANQLQFGGTASLLPQDDDQSDWAQPGLRIQAFEIHNRAGAAITVGVGFRFRNGIWEAGDFEAGTAYTRIRNYQSRTQTIWSAGFTEGDDDSLMIFSYKKFNWVSMNLTRDSSGGTVVTTLDYSDAAGTAWIDVNTASTFINGIINGAGDYGTGEKVMVWNPPHDWGKTAQNHGLGTGIPEGMYGLRLLFDTVAGTNDPGFTGMEIGSLKLSGEELADNGLFENEQLSWVENDADGVVAFFETAAAGNMIDLECAPAG